jgi:hypothetical protein
LRLDASHHGSGSYPVGGRMTYASERNQRQKRVCTGTDAYAGVLVTDMVYPFSSVPTLSGTASYS